MSMELSLVEKQYVTEVLNELKQYRISSKERKNIKQQLLEHFQESRDNGIDSINDLGDTTTFIKDFLEIKGIDLHSEIKQMRKSRPGISIALGFCTFIIAYLACQLLLSMFLTDSFNPQKTMATFHYNIVYQISDVAWWNFLLITISISTSSLISLLAIKIFGGNR
ncbi:hypothetical protein PVA17_01940 [Lysinibacillus sp. CNPSo 3705]|uniref:hypothetical protein n=1 Tax=Lysinibacillus sp. CNPSo 3705 TaxID=3028148 RepID=UPI00104298F1|nr:hypothetical protein [Lysinibacillus sp. CNPSo 3705]MDD1501534.1 hypothetical protein [Lysinibacillus sp. CNPSo 3705]